MPEMKHAPLAGEGEMKRMPKAGQVFGPVNHSNAARRRALISRKLLMNELMWNNARCQQKKEAKEGSQAHV